MLLVILSAKIRKFGETAKLFGKNVTKEENKRFSAKPNLLVGIMLFLDCLE